MEGRGRGAASAGQAGCGRSWEQASSCQNSDVWCLSLCWRSGRLNPNDSHGP